MKRRAEVKLPQFTCTKCGHTWNPRHPYPPKVCAKCKSRRWQEKDPLNPANMTAADRHLTKLFLRFHKEAHPARVRQVVATIETELKLLEERPARRGTGRSA